MEPGGLGTCLLCLHFVSVGLRRPASFKTPDSKAWRVLSGTFAWDPPHRVWNDTRHAIKNSGLQMTQVGATLAFNLSCGPWGGCAFFGTVSGAAKSFFAKACPSDGLVTLHYEVLAKDLCPSVHVGSQDHTEEVFHRAKDCDCFF